MIYQLPEDCTHVNRGRSHFYRWSYVRNKMFRWKPHLERYGDVDFITKADLDDFVRQGLLIPRNCPENLPTVMLR